MLTPPLSAVGEDLSILPRTTVMVTRPSPAQPGWTSASAPPPETTTSAVDREHGCVTSDRTQITRSPLWTARLSMMTALPSGLSMTVSGSSRSQPHKNNPEKAGINLRIGRAIGSIMSHRRMSAMGRLWPQWVESGHWWIAASSAELSEVQSSQTASVTFPASTTA